MTYEQLAKAEKVTPRTATTHIKSLEELKIIEVTRSLYTSMKKGHVTHQTSTV